MVKKKAEKPTSQGNRAYRIAKTAFDSIITNLPDGGDFVAIAQITKEIERFKLSYGHAESAFSFVEMFLRDYIESQGDDLNERTDVVVVKHLNILHSYAKRYFEDRILNDTKNDHVGDILVEVERLLEDSFNSIFFREALESVKENCERKIERQRKRAKIREELKMFDEPEPDNATPESKDQFDLTKEEKLLASICPLFRNATPDIQRKVWSKLSDFTRNQWAMFLIEAHPKKKDYASKAEAANALIKPIAKSIEAISGRTNMRGVVFNENSKQYAKDESDVKGITQILFADSIMRKSD